MTILHPDDGFDQVMATLPDGDGVILVRGSDGVVRGFRNRCPHVSVELDWGDGRCMPEPGVLVCSMHGAQFEADTGACFAGPCAGQSLEPIPVAVRDGQVVLA